MYRYYTLYKWVVHFLLKHSHQGFWKKKQIKKDNPDNSFKLTQHLFRACLVLPVLHLCAMIPRTPFNVSTCLCYLCFKIRDTVSWQIMKLVSCLLSRCLLYLFLCATSPQYSTGGDCTTNLWDTKPCESQDCVELAAVWLGFALNV